MAERERSAAMLNARLKRMSDAAATKTAKAEGAAEAVKLLLNGVRELLMATEDEARLLQTAVIEANSTTTICPLSSAETVDKTSAETVGQCLATAGRNCSSERAEAEANASAARRVQLLERLVEQLSAENADQV